jgi:hypothetical protein
MKELLARATTVTAAIKTHARAVPAPKRVAVVMAAGSVLALLPLLPSSPALAAYATSCSGGCMLANFDSPSIHGSAHGTEIRGNTGKAIINQWEE